MLVANDTRCYLYCAPFRAAHVGNVYQEVPKVQGYDSVLVSKGVLRRVICAP